jgi:hypothetical protein
MCGWPAGLVLLYLAKDDPGLIIRNAEYRNSGDTPYGNRDEVVGYNAIVFEKTITAASQKPAESMDFILTPEEKKTLLGIARNAISARLKGSSPAAVDPSRLTPRLKEPLGAFVTISIKGNLRGCIGRFT